MGEDGQREDLEQHLCPDHCGVGGRVVLRGDLDHIAADGSLTLSSLPAISWNSPRKSATSCKVYVRWSAMPHGMRNRLPDRERRPAAVAPDRPNGGRRCHSDQPARQISARMNAPDSETGPGPQLVTWGKSTILSVHPHGFKFEYTLNSAKHIPVDRSGPQ